MCQCANKTMCKCANKKIHIQHIDELTHCQTVYSTNLQIYKFINF